jgi:hypothetical protein
MSIVVVEVVKLSTVACSSGVSVPPSKIGDELYIHVSDAERRSLTMQHTQEATMDVYNTGSRNYESVFYIRRALYHPYECFNRRTHLSTPQ